MRLLQDEPQVDRIGEPAVQDSTMNRETYVQQSAEIVLDIQRHREII